MPAVVPRHEPRLGAELSVVADLVPDDDDEITDATLAGADFGGARLTDVTFDGADLQRATFDQVRSERVDLRGARVAELRGVGGLAGAVVAPDQLVALAPALAIAVGLTVEARADT